MDNLRDFLEQEFLGNRISNFLLAAGILIGGLIFKKYFSHFLSWVLYRMFKRYGKTIGVKKFIELLSAPAGFLVVIGIIYFAFSFISFPEEWGIVSEEIFGVRFVIKQFYEGAIIIGLTWLLIRVVEFVGLILLARAADTVSKIDDQFVPFFKTALQIIIGGIGVMTFLASVFDLKVVSILTGLGIGGIALALAAKETLENLLGSFTIFLDKPFKLGDRVKVGTNEGWVEHIGFRSTRIRALDRTLITVPNKKMVDYELINDSELVVRRSRFVVSLTYSTSAEQLRNVINDILELLNFHPLIEPEPIVRFNEFGESSLNILVIFLARTPDPRDFLKVREDVNFQIMEIVQKHKCDFAFPSRTIYMKNESESSIEKEAEPLG